MEEREQQVSKGWTGRNPSPTSFTYLVADLPHGDLRQRVHAQLLGDAVAQGAGEGRARVLFVGVHVGQWVGRWVGGREKDTVRTSPYLDQTRGGSPASSMSSPKCTSPQFSCSGSMPLIWSMDITRALLGRKKGGKR